MEMDARIEVISYPNKIPDAAPTKPSRVYNSGKDLGKVCVHNSRESQRVKYQFRQSGKDCHYLPKHPGMGA